MNAIKKNSPACHEQAQQVEWRRQESNECPVSSNAVCNREVVENKADVSAQYLQCADTNCLPLSRTDPRLRNIVELWDAIPEGIRVKVEAICLHPPSWDREPFTTKAPQGAIE